VIGKRRTAALAPEALVCATPLRPISMLSKTTRATLLAGVAAGVILSCGLARAQTAGAGCASGGGAVGGTTDGGAGANGNGLGGGGGAGGAAGGAGGQAAAAAVAVPAWAALCSFSRVAP
jgi:hypothetical protein